MNCFKYARKNARNEFSDEFVLKIMILFLLHSMPAEGARS